MKRLCILPTVMVVMVGALPFAAHEALAELLTGTAGNDTLVGTEEEDYLKGSGGDDYLDGGGGDDKIVPGEGDDVVYAGAGNDLIYARDTDSLDYIDCGSLRVRLRQGRDHTPRRPNPEQLREGPRPSSGSHLNGRLGPPASSCTHLRGRRCVLRSSSSPRVTRKSMRVGLFSGEKSPTLLVAGRFWWPNGHAKPTQSYPLVVVVPALSFVVVVPVLAFVVVADFGDDRGLSYEQATLEQVGVERLVQRFGRLGGQLGVDAP